jgi:hypothetical protein
VALIARQVQLNNLQLCRGVKYRLPTPVLPFQSIAAIPDLRPVETFDGTATNCDRPAGTQLGEPRWPLRGKKKEQS